MRFKLKLNTNKIMVAATGVAFMLGGATLFRESKSDTWYQGEEELFGRTVVVTGANTGLGKETAREFAYRGGRVIMACRDMAKCDAAREKIIESTFNRNVFCKKLDLASFKSIHEFAEDFNENEDRLDILVNNAGVMMLPARELTEEGIELHLGVNYLGPFLLTHLLLDKLKATAPSRIVNITCTFHQAMIDLANLNGDRAFWPKKAYDNSKLAVYLSSEKLGEKLAGTGVSVFCVNPGLCQTELQRHMSWYTSFISRYTFKPIFKLVTQPPLRGMQTILYCALQPDLVSKPLHMYMNGDGKDMHSTMIPSLDKMDKLWLTSEVWTQLKAHPSPQEPPECPELQ